MIQSAMLCITMAASINVERITGEFKDNLAKLGFEVYPFKVLWH